MSWAGTTRRRLAVVLSVFLAAGLLLVLAPAGAHAATATGCAGRKVRTLSFATGTVVIHKRGSYVCAATLPKRPGGRRHMSVSVQARGARPVVDDGRFTVRAGPVTVHAGQRCVWVRGRVDRSTVSSGWILC
ncbi:hypothetical protein [Streptomyces sp. NPDC003717]|uniref:hypothetical protein n=1 Tax=Streptomyces sp. NPDC003717 TaxID=3154276 RepID=UPI0033BCB756